MFNKYFNKKKVLNIATNCAQKQLKPIDIIYARDAKYGIGIVNDNKYDLPWQITSDIKYFNNITSMTSNGIPNDTKMNAVIMGRNTWESIPEKFRPLPNRFNVILSKNMNIDELKLNNTKIFNNIEQSLDFLNSNENIENIFVIGGSQIYNYFLNNKNFRFLYETVVNYDFNCNIHVNKYTNLLPFYNKSFDVTNLKNNEKVSISFDRYVNLYYSKDIDQPCDKIIPKNKNIEEQQYLDTLEELIRTGDFRKTRNGNTWSLFDKTFKFDLSKGFPLLTTKRVLLNHVFQELSWFLKGDTNAKHLNDVGVKIWNGNSSKEFIEKTGLKLKEGDIGPMYGFNWKHFGAEYDNCDSDYANKGFDQIKYCLDLIKNDPTSRRIIMTTFDPANAHKGVLYPCHSIVTQFYVSNGKLHMSTYQR